jgi:hypothetical protein
VSLIQSPFLGGWPHPPILVLDALVLVNYLKSSKGVTRQYSLDVMSRLRTAAALLPAGSVFALLDHLRNEEARGSMSAIAVDRFLSSIQLFTVHIDEESVARAWTDTLPLMRLYSLPPPEAALIEAARRRSLPLATVTPRLRQASAAEGVALFVP